MTGVTPPGAPSRVSARQLAAGYLEQGMPPRQVDRLLRDTYCVSQTRRELCIEAAQAGLKAKAALRRGYFLAHRHPLLSPRCAYCSFVSQAVEKSWPYGAVSAGAAGEITRAAQMVKELGLNEEFLHGRRHATLFSAGQMDRLLTHLNQILTSSLRGDTAHEAGRPDTIDREKPRCFWITAATASA